MNPWIPNVNYQMIISIHLAKKLSRRFIFTDTGELQQNHLAWVQQETHLDLCKWHSFQILHWVIIANCYATISILWFSHITICHLISIIALGVLLTNRLKWALLSWIGWSKRCSAMWMVIVDVQVLQRKIITMNGVLHEIFSQMQTEISTSVKVMITTNSYYGI